MTLDHLIAEACGLANSHPCDAVGHLWRFVGGRMCQMHGEPCSESVYQCARCGEFTYHHIEGECSWEMLEE